jgi:hypothetical protein
MSTLQKTMLVGLAVLTLVLVVIVIKGILDGRNNLHNQAVAVAEDLGCTFIEQSYHHPENFYIDCGNNNIRIIKVENK